MTSLPSGQLRRSSRRADAMSGPAKRTRAATAGAPLGAASSAQENAQVSLPGKRRRERRLREEVPDPHGGIHASSAKLVPPQALADVNLEAAEDSGDTSANHSSHDGAHKSSQAQEHDAPDGQNHLPAGDGSTAVPVDMMFWTIGLGRLQVRQQTLSTDSPLACMVLTYAACSETLAVYLPSCLRSCKCRHPPRWAICRRDWRNMKYSGRRCGLGALPPALFTLLRFTCNATSMY
jgi:hypothetical protein